MHEWECDTNCLPNKIDVHMNSNKGFQWSVN